MAKSPSMAQNRLSRQTKQNCLSRHLKSCLFLWIYMQWKDRKKVWFLFYLWRWISGSPFQIPSRIENPVYPYKKKYWCLLFFSLRPAAPRRTRDGGRRERKRRVHQVGIPGGTCSIENTMLRILGSLLVGGLCCWILYLKKKHEMGFFGNFFLWTCFHSLFSQQKRKGFSLFWIQIRETLVFSFSYNGSQKCLSQRSDWEGSFPSLWWVH